MLLLRENVILTRKDLELCRYNEIFSRYNDIIEWEKYYVCGSITSPYSVNVFPTPIIRINCTSSFKKHNLYFSLSLLPLLACTYLNKAWDLVFRALPLSVCLVKINRFMYSPIVSRFG